jgi:acyl-CoA synthetase (AMP-forming)/AMP-acid ligase II
LVGELCVLGRPGPRGDEIVAVVTASAVARERYAGVDLERALVAEVRRFSADLAPYKRPSQIVVHHQDLPQTATRKVRRADAQELVGFEERVHAHG